MTTQRTQIASSQSPFYFQSGSRLDFAEIAWKFWGELSPQKDNAILLFPVLTTGCHAAGHDECGPGVSWWTRDCYQGWWDEFIGPGRALDTNRWCVICPSFLGGCYGSTGPASINPATGKVWGESFPFPRVADLVDANVRLLDRLGIEKLHGVVGASFGGYLALDFALRHPQRTSKVASVASGLRVTPAMKLANFQQVMAIESHLNLEPADFDRARLGCEGLTLARMIAMQQYIVAHEVDTYCGDRVNGSLKPKGCFPLSQPLESWLLYQGKKFSRRFDAHSYLRLLHAWQSWNLDFQRFETVAKAAFDQCRHQRWLLFSIDSDVCFPTEEQTLLKNTLTSARISNRLVPVSSRLGHDSFIQEPASYTPELKAFFVQEESPVAATVPKKEYVSA